MLIDRPRLPLRKMLAHGWWPSAAKTWLYRLKGYRIGRGVRFGFGAIIDGESVEIGDHVELGLLSFVRGRLIRIGDHVQIGATTMIDTPHLEIGAGTRINEQVFIGGLQFPDSRLVIGRNCQIMQMSFINPTRSITIGDDTGIGGHSLLFGHTSWLSAFEGYTVDFDSIEIGNSVSIAWRVFVLPGARVGDGSVVGANSLVKGSIPPRSLAIGFPARVVSAGTEFPKVLTDGEKTRLLSDILREFVRYLEGAGFGVTLHADSLYEIVDRRDRGRNRSPGSWRLVVHTADDVTTAACRPGDVLLSLRRIPEEVRASATAAGLSWIDIEAKERSDRHDDFADEVAQYLRRYGVRFVRIV